MQGALTVIAPVFTPDEDELFKSFNSEAQLCRHLARSVDITDFERRIRELLQLFGIDLWFHADINMVVDILDVFGPWPKELIARYAKEEFYRDDLVLRHMMTSNQPLFIHRVYDFLKNTPFKCELLARNLEIQKLLYRYKLYNVFCIPVEMDNCRSIFTVAERNCDKASFEENIVRHLSHLRMLGRAVSRVGHEKYSKKFHGEIAKLTIPIHNKPLQLLQQLAIKDLNLNEAAEVLGISISTANQHIAAAKKAFGTNTTHGTVVAAILGGHIVIDI